MVLTSNVKRGKNGIPVSETSFTTRYFESGEFSISEKEDSHTIYFTCKGEEQVYVVDFNTHMYEIKDSSGNQVCRWVVSPLQNEPYDPIYSADSKSDQLTENM